MRATSSSWGDDVSDLAPIEAHPIAELVGVSVTYPSNPPVEALQSCDLSIEAGQYVAIMGPSGSGKSTLLNVLGMIDVPTEGSYHFEGEPTSEFDERVRCAIRAHRIGFVFQSFHLVSYRTALENVEMGLLYQRVARSERRERAAAELERIGLAHRMLALPPEMSGGERQRVAIARATVRNPALLLCDEPTGNLDTTNGKQILDLVDELHRGGLTIVVITHDRQVGRRAQHVIELRDGRVRRGESRRSRRV